MVPRASARTPRAALAATASTDTPWTTLACTVKVLSLSYHVSVDIFVKDKCLHALMNGWKGIDRQGKEKQQKMENRKREREK